MLYSAKIIQELEQIHRNLVAFAALANSTVRKSSANYELEVHLNKHSQVTSWPRKLELGDVLRVHSQQQGQ